MATSLKDDFYEAVNGDWIAQATIPSDHSSTGGFMDLVDGVDEKLMNDFKQMQSGKLKVETPELMEFLKFFRLAADFKQRDADGVAPLLPFLKRIESLNNWTDLNEQIIELSLDGFDVPLDLGVEPDLKGDGANKKNVLWAGGLSLILPDKTYYEDTNPAGKQLMDVFTQMMIALFEKLGKTTDEATLIVEAAKRFDASFAPYRKNSEELSDVAKLYNPQSFESFTSAIGQLDAKKMITGLLGTTPDQVIVTEPRFFENYNQFVNAENFEDIKAWMMVNVVRSLSPYLSEEMRQLGGTYGRALSGQKEAMKQEKSAFYLSRSTFNQVVGQYYGNKYFGEEAKQDVHDMVVAMINVYEKRLQQNDWLGQATKEKAITKLKSLKILVGYPDELKEVYKKLKTKTADEGSSLVENVQNFSKIFLEDNLSKFGKEVDRSEWHMSADTVNAYYSPEGNLICFPAAILQAPFYSLKQSASQNYGGIGAVIAHEISHAFDPNGALFDEYGNLDNWWTDDDLSHFHELSQAMVDEFDGLEFAGGKVNGKLVVTENVADDGGMSAALEATKQTANPDLKAFFVNWATIWRTKATKEREQLLLSIDVHAPAKLRANVQVKNFDEFYEAFNVHKDDGMYLEPAKRVQIW
ncbi:M13 family metallopeptidase [Pediococcus claussenii]|uniref:Neutral endopeptidase n=1 Tax=Pediococcus claussenii (strain ATCC BAA-344 / DSM 14800 / JCM 18046 / KCTC 3811 / LMG 21948 / P06) TaxID=701521 RepID=G8PBJ4_PEDCP|nr:M13-type metalloendopeptidase [Pediococcus claussenii]AEV94743.1 neutral endopeptidase [Pediococcus claussenii ATCC BAA-344]ANZ69939.1 peptidase M13 [Pediococcus claussenii]ANZ71755.1 peptidase M13 [Pediococcus claussenii]KRN20922.1 pepO protein [Pediococcus claussenii]